MELPSPAKCKFIEVHFLFIVRKFAKRFHIVETINTLAASRKNLSFKNAVLAMVMDVVTGRKLLCQLGDSLHGQDTELILGKHIDAAEFNGTNLGLLMDKLHEAGAEQVFPKYLKIPSMGSNCIRSASLRHHIRHSVQGLRYTGVPLKITHKYSKDKRLDLNQFMVPCCTWVVPYSSCGKPMTAIRQTICA